MSELAPSEESLRVLDELPAFRAMPDDVRRLVGESFEPVAYDFGQVIVREGDPADAFYVVVSGSARVLKRAENGEEVPLNLLGRGESFGEMSLLTDSTRSATVRASGRVHALRLDRETFTEMTRWHPAVRAQFERLADYRTVQDFLRLHSAFATLPVDGLALIAASLEPVDVEAGEIVVREGDPPGPMYVIEDGRLRAFLERDGHREDINYLRKGDSFGELSVLEGRPRTASVEALTPCRLLRLTPELFARLLDEYPEFRGRLEERAVQFDSLPVARVPLDFAEILPAETEVALVGPEQVEDAIAAPAGAEAAEELEEAAPQKKRRWWQRRRYPHVYQLDEMDCGAACLGALTRYFGRPVSLPRIRELVHTSVDGTSLLGIARGAEALGLDARTVRASKSNSRRAPAAGDRPLGRQPLGRALRGRREGRPCRRPGARRPQARPRRVRGEVDRLRGADLDYAGLRGAAGGDDQPRLAEAVPATAQEGADRGVRPGADRRRPRARDSDLHAARRRQCDSAARQGAARDRSRRHARRARDHGRGDDPAALHPRLRRRPDRHGEPGLPDGKAALAADVVLHDPADRRHRAAPLRDPRAAAVLHRERRRGADRDDPAGGGARAHVRLLVGVGAHLRRARAAVRAADALLVVAAAADVRLARGGATAATARSRSTRSAASRRSRRARPRRRCGRRCWRGSRRSPTRSSAPSS